MPGKYQSVKDAVALTKEQRDAILLELGSLHSGRKVSTCTRKTVNDFSADVHQYCVDKRLSIGDLPYLFDSKSGKSKEQKKTLAEMKKALPFLDEKRFRTYNGSQKDIFDKWAKGDDLEKLPTDQELKEAGFQPGQITAFKKYAKQVLDGKALHPDLHISQVLIAARTPHTEGIVRTVQDLAKIDSKSLPRIKSGMQSCSMSVQKEALSALQLLTQATEEEFSVEEAWRQFLLMHNFRPTRAQIYQLEFFLGLATGEDSTPSALIEGSCGCGKTFGLAIVMMYVRQHIARNGKGKYPMLAYSHPNPDVIFGVEANFASCDTPMAFVERESLNVEGVIVNVLVIRLCHETTGKGTLKYTYDEDGCIIRRIQSPAKNGVVIDGKTGGSREGDPVNPLLDLYVMITHPRGPLTAKAMPCVFSVRNQELLPIVLSWHQDLAILKERDDDARSKMYVGYGQRYLNTFTKTVGVADDWCCHEDSPWLMNMLVANVPILLMTATPNDEALRLISDERVERGMSPTQRNKATSDTVGLGNNLILVKNGHPIPSNGRASTTFLMHPKIFSKCCFYGTTVAMLQVCECLRQLVGSLDFRNMLIRTATTGEGLNEMRSLLLEKIQRGVDISSLHTPISLDSNSRFLEFRNDRDAVRAQLPTEVDDSIVQLKILDKDHKAFLQTKERAKKSAQSMMKAGGDGAKDGEADMEDAKNMSFSHRLITRRLPIGGDDVMKLVNIAVEEGVPAEEIMAFVSHGVLAVYTGVHPGWWMVAMKHAQRILSDKEMLATGVTLPNLTGVSIHCVDGLTPEQIIQMVGRAGRPGQQEGTVPITSEQERTVMVGKLGERWLKRFKKQFPSYGVSDEAISAVQSLQRWFRKVARVRHEEEENRRLVDDARLEAAAVKIQCLIRMGRVTPVATIKAKIAAKRRRKKLQMEKKRFSSVAVILQRWCRVIIANRLAKEANQQRSEQKGMLNAENESKSSDGMSNLSRLLNEPSSVKYTKQRQKNMDRSKQKLKEQLIVLLGHIYRHSEEEQEKFGLWKKYKSLLDKYLKQGGTEKDLS